MTKRGKAWALWALWALAAPSAARAQATTAEVGARDRLPTPGKSLASVDDTDALAVNPAGLALMPSWEMRALVARGERPDRGVSVGLGTPLVFDFSGGVRADFVRPSGPTEGKFSDAGRTWLTAALGYQSSERTALGLSASRSYSDDAAFAGQWGLTAGVTWRAWSWLGFAATARNFNGHRNGAGVPLASGFDLGALLRPTGRRDVEIGLDALDLQEKDKLVPRLTLGVQIPHLGRLRGEVQVARPFEDDRSWTASAGLDLGLGNLMLGGGWLGAGGSGRAFGGDQAIYGSVAVRGYRDGGVDTSRYFVKIRVESTPGPRSHVRLLKTLWKLAADPHVAGVALQLKTEPSGSTAHAEELGDALRMLRSRGKKVLCLLEDAGGRALQVCSQADRTYMNPAGGLRFAGLRSQYFYLGGLLQKIGVRADFVRVAEHKTAPEQFTERQPTPTAEADHIELLQQLEKTFVHDVGGGRQISEPELRGRLARGPFTAREARAANLIDGYAYDDELDAAVAEAANERLRVFDAGSAPALADEPDAVMGSRDRVAIVYVDGDMIDGRSRTLPLINNRLVGSYTVVAALKQAREDSRVRAVVLRLETPGGSSLAADVIWREVALTARVKPVVASMGAIAASAGYYVASAAGRIWANRSTLTGSIGIYYGKADVEGLMQKLGVNLVTYRTAPRADAESLYRPFTDDERQELGRKVKQFYDTFVDRVARGRKLTPAEVDAVARGKVWTGEQAIDKKLVDRLGGLREALDEARSLAGISADAPTVELPSQPRDLLTTALELAGLAQAQGKAEGADATPPRAASPALPLPPETLRLLRLLAPFAVYEPDVPLARLEGAPEFP